MYNKIYRTKPFAQKKLEIPRWHSIYFTLLNAIFILFWLNQTAINAYWQQTYHSSSPLELFNQFKLWNLGKTFSLALNQQYQTFLQWIEDKNHHWKENKEITQIEKEKIDEEDSPSNTISIAESEIAPPKIEEDHLTYDKQKENLIYIQNTQSISTNNLSISIEKNEYAENSAPSANHSTEMKVVLSPKDKVFFVGDSLMQGVAPHVQRKLKSQFKIDSINLSRQSTGLSYPSFFDWPLTVEKTLKSDPTIKLIVVFLGPNDPWDFPNPNKHQGPYLKFKSAEWEWIYRQRINRIITSAENNHTDIIWLGVPMMKSKKLNEQMIYLNQILQSEVENSPQEKHKIFWLPTDNLLSNGTLRYSDKINLGGKNVQVRSKDGIHFSLNGQQYLAEYILQYIELAKEDQK